MRKFFASVFLIAPLCGWGQNVVFNPGFDMTPWDTGWTIETNVHSGAGTAIAEVKPDTGRSSPNCCYLKTYTDMFNVWGYVEARAKVYQYFNAITGCTLKAQIKYYWNVTPSDYWDTGIAIEVRVDTLWHPVWDTVHIFHQGGDTVWSGVSVNINDTVTGIRFCVFCWDHIISTSSCWLDLHFWVDDVYVEQLGVEESAELKVKSEKLKISPNPFIKSTILNYQLPVKSKVSLRIYDISGRCAKILVDGEKEPGYYKAMLDSKDLTSGVYFAKFVAGDYKATKKLILLGRYEK